MTAVTITGQASLLKPVSVPHFFMRATEGDVGSGALKTITDAFPVPAHVLSGGGTIGSRRAELSDEGIEACVRDWCYRNSNWTGTAAAGVPTNGRTIDIYNWMVANAAANSGKGPTMDCGSIAKVYIGFLAGYGITARQVYGRTASAVDNTAEYWSPAKAGWVHVLPHVNGHIEFDATGVRASLHDWTQIERLTGSRTGKVHPVYLGGSDGTNLKSGISAGGWAGYSKLNVWTRGNRQQFPSGGVDNTLAWTPFQPSVIGHQGNINGGVRLYEPIGTYSGDATTLAGTVKARHLNDVEFNINALHMAAEAQPSGMVKVQLENNLLDFSKYQVKPPGGAWTDMEPSGSYAFLPIAGDVWQFRGVGVLGNTTNTVTATVS